MLGIGQEGRAMRRSGRRSGTASASARVIIMPDGRTASVSAGHKRWPTFGTPQAGLPTQHRILMPEHQQLDILRAVPTEQQDDQAEHPTRQHVSDLEQHPASQPPPPQTCWR
jgi:hypothetical protein